ncbi:MAG: hypothetical protein IPK94_07980 [Saprospiraceae bacterium]|nr:hypothetical protein [Saprospiraceae bacterium]
MIFSRFLREAGIRPIKRHGLIISWIHKLPYPFSHDQAVGYLLFRFLEGDPQMMGWSILFIILPPGHCIRTYKNKSGINSDEGSNGYLSKSVIISSGQRISSSIQNLPVQVFAFRRKIKYAVSARISGIRDI